MGILQEIFSTPVYTDGAMGDLAEIVNAARIGRNLSMLDDLPEFESPILNLDRGSLDELTGGEWRTIKGARVYIKDGVVAAGAAHLKGMKVGDVEGHGKVDTKEKPGYHQIERDATGGYVGTKGKDGTVSHVQEHADRLKALKIAPGYTKVHLAEDLEAMRQAYQTDSKGRETRVYSDAHHVKQSAAKFARVKKFVAKLPEIREAITNHPSEEAAALRLIDQTGVRIGSDADTGADKKAFGATTLRSEHVVTDPDGRTALHFTGKKGVQIHQPINDPTLANELKERAKSGGKLYNTSDAKVRDRLHSIAPGFKVKDFRTAVAADTAMNAMKGVPTPTNLADLVKARKAVGDTVAAKLGNTGTVALKSYIPPEVFSGWEGKAANLEQAKLIEGHAAKTGLNPGEAAKDWITKNAATYRENFNRKLGKTKAAAGKRQLALSRAVWELSRRTDERQGRTDGGISGGSGRRVVIELPALESQILNLDRSSDLTGGAWKTIDGTHVYIKDGVVVAGPAHLKGRTHKEIHETMASTHDALAYKTSRHAAMAHAEGKSKEGDALAKRSNAHAAKASELRKASTQPLPDAPHGRSTTGKPRTPFDMHKELESSLGLGKLTVPLDEHGNVDAALESSYRDIAKRKGLEIGEFKKGSRNATATVDRKSAGRAAPVSPMPEPPKLETKVEEPKRTDSQKLSDKANDKSYLSSVGKGDAAEHDAAALAHATAQHSHAIDGNKTEAADHEKQAAYHQREAANSRIEKTSSEPVGTGRSLEGKVSPPDNPLDYSHMEHGLGNVPEYARDEINNRYTMAKRLGVVDKIADLSINGRMTADQVVSHLPDVQLKPFEKKEMIRGVRAKLGIPSQDDATEFEKFRSDFQAKRNSMEGWKPSGQQEKIPESPKLESPVATGAAHENSAPTAATASSAQPKAPEPAPAAKASGVVGKPKPSIGTTKLASGKEVEMTAPGGFNPKKHVIVNADPAKVAAHVKATQPSHYVGPGGVGESAKPGAYAGVARHVEGGGQLDSPRVHYENNVAKIGDGRHRMAYLNDQGAKSVPVQVNKDGAKAFTERFGATGETPKVPAMELAVAKSAMAEPPQLESPIAKSAAKPFDANAALQEGTHREDPGQGQSLHDSMRDSYTRGLGHSEWAQLHPKTAASLGKNSEAAWDQSKTDFHEAVQKQRNIPAKVAAHVKSTLGLSRFGDMPVLESLNLSGDNPNHDLPAMPILESFAYCMATA